MQGATQGNASLPDVRMTAEQGAGMWVCLLPIHPQKSAGSGTMSFTLEVRLVATKSTDWKSYYEVIR